MKQLPERPDLEHLKRQAKALLAAYRRGEGEALEAFRQALPAAHGKDDGALRALDLRLHDAQSCIARGYGFLSWTELKAFVLARGAAAGGQVMSWLRLVYAGDISGGTHRARPAVAARLLAAEPALLGADPYLACAVGDEAALRAMTRRQPDWVNRPGGPLGLPPLVAVTHAGLLRLPDFRERLRASARFLLAAGADPNQSAPNRWMKGPGEAPDEEHRLSALYGAAGQNHDPELTALLLEAGADPNDGESLYHAVESADCTRLLLVAGARIEGTNALYRVLDLDRLDVLELLLECGGDANEAAGTWAENWPLLWAIRRRRSPAHVTALLRAGADPRARTRDGLSAYVLALRYGLPEVAALLKAAGGGEVLSPEEAFLAACAAGNEASARLLQAERPNLPAALSEKQLRLLPELAAQGCGAAVRLMVRLGWPLEVRAGDWNATALNLAIFRGDAATVRFLLEQGADWRTPHGFGDNASGTLSWASLNEPEEGEGDWPGCAAALLEHGLPVGGAAQGGVLIEGQVKYYADAVTEVLLGTA